MDSSCAATYFPTLGRAQRSEARDAYGSDLVPHRHMLKALAGGLAWCTCHMLFIYTAGDLCAENPSFMAINVNRPANSSVNYHWERKQAGAFRKANSFMRKPHAWLRMTPLSPYLEVKERRPTETREKKKPFLKVTPLELFYIKDGRREENTLWLWFVYHTDKNNSSLFFFPTQSREYEAGLFEPQTNQRACFSSFLIHAR